MAKKLLADIPATPVHYGRTPPPLYVPEHLEMCIRDSVDVAGGNLYPVFVSEYKCVVVSLCRVGSDDSHLQVGDVGEMCIRDSSFTCPPMRSATIATRRPLRAE